MAALMGLAAEDAAEASASADAGENSAPSAMQLSVKGTPRHARAAAFVRAAAPRATLAAERWSRAWRSALMRIVVRGGAPERAAAGRGGGETAGEPRGCSAGDSEAF